MKTQKDIQELIPEAYRDVVEVIPRGFLRGGALSALLFGALLGALLVYVVPVWLVSTVVIILLVIHYLYTKRSDKLYDKRLEELKARDLDWKMEHEKQN